MASGTASGGSGSGRATISTGTPRARAASSLAAVAVPPGVLADQLLDAVPAQQRQLVGQREWAGGGDQRRARQRGRRRRVDAAYSIFVPRPGGERGELLLADRQQHPARRGAQRDGGRLEAVALGPEIAGLLLPARAPDDDQGDAGNHGDGLAGVARHGGGEGVRRVDQDRGPAGAQVGGEPGGGAEAARPHRDRLGQRMAGDPGEAQHGRNAASERAGQRRGLAGAAEDEDAE